MTYALPATTVTLACALAAIVYLYRDLRTRLRQLHEMTARAGASVERRMKDLDELLGNVRHAVTAPGPLTQALLLEQHELREWALERATKDEIASLTRVLEQASERLNHARQVVHDAGDEWIEVA
jgi:hypothetical protein